MMTSVIEAEASDPVAWLLVLDGESAVATLPAELDGAYVYETGTKLSRHLDPFLFLLWIDVG